MHLTVGQLAKMSGITVRALHHYDARGLLRPSQRSDAGYRLYSREDVVRLYRIQALQRLGMSLAEIAGALERDSTTLPGLVRQQLIELDEQIARSTLVRNQLMQLETRLATSDGPSMAEWLRALEVLGTYDKHCSGDDLQRLLANNNDSDWLPFVQEIRTAMERGIDHDSDEARALALRWAALAMTRFGGDPALAKKMKLAYLDDPAVRARVAAQSGFDLSMMQFCLHITMQAHRHFWSRHLPSDAVSQLRIDDEWSRAWGAFVAELNTCLSDGLEASRADRLRSGWHGVLSAFAGGDVRLVSQVEAGLFADRDLQTLWGVGGEALDVLRRMEEVSA